jgi:hypothetical protein
LCIARYLHEAVLESALYDVIPHVKFDYVSYSSYQSLNTPDARKGLLADLETIRSVVGSSAIIIGEIMTASSSADPTVFTQSLREVMDAALAWGVPYMIYWNLYSPANGVWGLFDEASQITELGKFFEAYLSGK